MMRHEWQSDCSTDARAGHGSPLKLEFRSQVLMNTDQMTGKWKQMKGAAKQQWGKLTDDDLQVIDGKRDVLVGKLQERYGIAKEDAQKKADERVKSYGPSDEHAAYTQRQEEANREQHHTAGKR